MKKYFIEAPAPTPNGRLHLGHMAGPYINADVFNRIQRANGYSTFFSCDLDRSQSYVRLAAIKKEITREVLLKENINSIKETFVNYDIGFDLFNAYDTEDRTRFIVEFVRPLLKSKFIALKEVEFFFDESSNQFLIEAFISGLCKKCNSPTKGGSCEICGYYNFSVNLVNPYSTINPQTKLSKKSCKIYVLNIEPMYSILSNVINNSSIEKSIKEFIFKNLLNTNTEFPITLPLQDGIPFGSAETELSPWVEVLCGTYYLKEIAKKTLDCKNFEDLSHVCFSGIDNVLHFTVMCNAIRICLDLKDFPESYFINRYYVINNDKFSTSRNNAVWADDITSQFNIDILRFFLCLTHPSIENYNFSLQQLIDFQADMSNRDWINKLSSFITNSHADSQIISNIPSVNAQYLLDVIREKISAPPNLVLLIQALCPTLSKIIIRKMGVIPQIVKQASNSFKQEYGVKVNRLAHINEDKFSSAIAIVELGNQTEPHKHENIDELFYIIEGNGLLVLNNQHSIVNKGDYIYIPAGMMHTIKQMGPEDLKFITIAWKK